ncbi:3-hydroxyisobutyrate dehydrogenase [Parvibaculum sp.]|uniref:3-hydroxyisobutyrate dehydrogenase n=1 Tax=Parvibaculum sp. TaxID=2024848 RepID=UPI001B12288A|nr:3-hydroxyisobutyrate dehydrogenase [Parvibaculum sp.]MBO6635978.1 3-hydroxyisobutyrate dehydrogenase [Parvibaculum sp.]MBO6680224.1 3-hydroxyisobutyrate dehydrogenase [Parvibaculum sp.]MBO6686104.1 3-hydroxyisobutyrate dehydrogenase [Parvibaculum sp.]MBO6906476.1 3-hydroxyisobutyrate dehydrogenase [Parvibaculum sp.]
MAAIGFIGLGNMGGPMARNLLKAGHALKVFDLSAAAVDGLVEAGATKAASASDAAADVEFVVTMLPAGEHVRTVYLGDGGLLASAAKGTLFIDSSTIDIPSARETIAAAEKAGMMMLDAPVSGGVGGAEAGTLTFMVGGAAEAFAKAKPILEKMGKNIFHAGAAGNGQVAKVCNNMILGISMIGVSEAFVLGEKLGLDAQTLFDISSTASGQCWSMTSYCPVPGPVPASPANRNYKPGFTAGMMLKDLRLAQDAAKTARSPIPLGAQAAQLYALMEAAGEDNIDFSGVIRLIRGEI